MNQNNEVRLGSGELVETNASLRQQPDTLDSMDHMGTWCLERKDNPDIALCGNELYGPIIPIQETPEEIICPKCLRIKKAGGWK